MFTLKKLIVMSLAVFIMLPTVAMANFTADLLASTYRKPTDRHANLLSIIENRDNAIGDLRNIVKSKRTVKLSAYEERKEMDSRVTAINLLGELKDNKSLVELNRLLISSDDPSLIFNSARSMGKISGKEAFVLLSRALLLSLNKSDERNEFIKKATVLGLGICGQKQAVPLLKKVLKNPKNNQLLKIYAAGSLGLLGSEEGLDIATNGVQSSNSQIRQRSIQALGLIGNQSSQKILQKEIQSKKFFIKNTASLALARVEYRHIADGDKVGFIKKQLEQHPRNQAFIGWGTRNLSKIDTFESLDVLEKYSRQENKRLQRLKNAAEIQLKLIRNR